MLVRPVLPAFEQKKRPDPTTDPRPCLSRLLPSPTTVTLVPAASKLCDQPPSHFATTIIPHSPVQQHPTFTITASHLPFPHLTWTRATSAGAKHGQNPPLHSHNSPSMPAILCFSLMA